MVTPRVLGARALLKPLEANEATAGGVVLPSEVREREARGIVVATGHEEEPPVEVGDVVVFAEEGASPYSRPTWVTLDAAETGHAERLVVVEFADILLVLDEAEGADLAA